MKYRLERWIDTLWAGPRWDSAAVGCLDGYTDSLANVQEAFMLMRKHEPTAWYRIVREDGVVVAIHKGKVRPHYPIWNFFYWYETDSQGEQPCAISVYAFNLEQALQRFEEETGESRYAIENVYTPRRRILVVDDIASHKKGKLCFVEEEF